MIKLEPFSSEDFQRLISWVTDAKILVQFAGTKFKYPLSIDQLETHLNENKRYVFKGVLIPENNVIGHAEIQVDEPGIGLISRVIIGDPNYRGKGLGKELLSAVCKKGFDELNLQQLDLNVYDWNHQAIQCYKQVGFEIIPFKKRITIFNGEEWNVLRMRISKKLY